MRNRRNSDLWLSLIAGDPLRTHNLSFGCHFSQSTQRKILEFSYILVKTGDDFDPEYEIKKLAVNKIAEELIIADCSLAEADL